MRFDFLRGVDLVIVLVSLFGLIFVVGYVRPLVIAPVDDFETFDSEVLFSIENGDELLIDDNVDFSSPDVYSVVDGLKISLEPGKYYWRVFGLGASEVRTLTVNSVVSLRLVEDGDFFNVVNSGNLVLNVDVYNGTEKIDSKRLVSGEKKSFDGDKLLGEAA